ncbi:MAG: PIN domain-containing protein [Anaerolineae bacterium]
MPFVDTNIFLRYLTRDDPDKAQACYDLFKRAEANQVTLTATETVIAEVVYVLSSRRTYHLPRDQIRARLYPLLTLQGLRLPQRRTVLRALDLYASYEIDFEDALIVAHMERQNIRGLYSYDGDFDQVPGVKRQEP